MILVLNLQYQNGQGIQDILLDSTQFLEHVEADVDVHADDNDGQQRVHKEGEERFDRWQLVFKLYSTRKFSPYKKKFWCGNVW